ncbi:MAG: adenylate/guanylate cyclase domain-containing protein [Pseudomonadota bacterium]|nr:adenylate/guanylate cyclase domain-containing protein [Pseudomonadota bacterium]
MSLSINFTKKYLARSLGGVCALFLVFLSLWNPDFVNFFRLKAYDAFLHQEPGLMITDTSIIIVDIDDRSLSELGQWPWPRSLLAEILSQIGLGKPKVVGLDIVFAEPDRLSPKMVIAALNVDKITPICRHQLENLPDHDQILVESLKDIPVVLGFPFTFSAPSFPGLDSQMYQRPGRFAVIGSHPGPWLFQASAVVANLQNLAAAAAGSGFFNILPDTDGIIRKIPLVIQYNQDIYPGLVLEMIRIGNRASINRIRCSTSGLESVKCGPYIIPVDAHGQTNIRYCARENSFSYISAVDILNRQVNPDIFQDAYVLIGTSAPGLVDIVATPTASIFPGVEVHAQALNTILTRSHIRNPDWSKGAELCYLLCISVMLIVLVPIIGALKGGLLFLLSGSGIVLFSYWLFHSYGFYFDPVYPLLCNGLVFFTLIFINYFQEEKGRRQTRTAFAKYISPVLIDELLDNPEKLAVTGEERVVTAMFSDIRDFTKISESISPEEVCTSLNQYFTVISKILMDRGALVDKYIGDAVYAFWNAPIYDPNHAQNAILAALEMREGLKILNYNWIIERFPVIKAGIAINTGSVRVGNIGSENRLSYTAMGDAVNLTARLEGVTKKYGVSIIVNSPTYELVDKEEFIFCKLDHIRVSGRHEPVTIYELLGKKSQVSNVQTVLIKERETALERYFAGDFQTARRMFQQLPEGAYDRLRRIFIKRCRDHVDNPPGSFWDGINNLDSK